jgi:hypothetical protein
MAKLEGLRALVYGPVPRPPSVGPPTPVRSTFNDGTCDTDLELSDHSKGKHFASRARQGLEADRSGAGTNFSTSICPCSVCVNVDVGLGSECDHYP